jgi:hypothetical protein
LSKNWVMGMACPSNWPHVHHLLHRRVCRRIDLDQAPAHLRGLSLRRFHSQNGKSCTAARLGTPPGGPFRSKRSAML